MAFVETDIQDQIMIIKLNRPDRLNALSEVIREGMSEAFTKFEPGQRYAVSFVSPGKQFNFNHLTWAGGVVGGGTVILYSAAIGAAVGSVIPIAGTAVGGAVGTVVGVAGAGVVVLSSIAFHTEGTVRDINFMMLTNYDMVSGIYAETTVDKEAG